MSNVVIGLALLKQTTKDGKPNAIFLGQATDASKLSLLVRSKAGEFMKFAFRQVAVVLTDKALSGQWDENLDFMVHGVRVGSLCMISISSKTYPGVRAIRIMKQQLAKLTHSLPPTWAGQAADCSIVKLEEQLREYSLERVSDLETLQKELDETKQIVADNIKAILDREDKLKQIVADSEDLSNMAKDFMTETKKLRCKCFSM